MTTPQPFDFKGLSKEVFSNWKKFFKGNFVFTKIINPKEISDPIRKAIEEKEIPKTDLSIIAKPILKKLTDIQDAIEFKENQEEVSVKNIEQARTDMSEVISVLQEILGKNTEITVEPAKTDITINISAIVKKLDELKKAIPTIEKPEIKDYSDSFVKIVDAIRNKKESADYSAFLAEIKEVLDNIEKKKVKEYPFEFDKSGRLKVEVDKVGGGGFIDTSSLATEEKQDDIIAALGEQAIPAGAITVGTRDLTAANTWYAVPSTVPTADYLLTVTIENGIGDIRFSPDDVSAPSATYGHRAPGELVKRMKANTSLFYGSSAAGDDVNWSCEVI